MRQRRGRTTVECVESIDADCWMVVAVMAVKEVMAVIAMMVVMKVMAKMKVIC
jgi:hypothetical protein